MTGRVRVLQVAWRYSRGGGKTQVGRDLIAHHDPARVDLHAFSVRPLYDDDALDALGTAVTFHSAGFTGTNRRAGAFRAIPLLDRVIRRVRPDVLHLHAGWDWWIAPSLVRRQRPAILLEIHDPPGTGKASTKHAWFLRSLVRRPRVRALVHSAWNHAETTRALGVDDAAVACFPLGIDLSQARPSPEERGAARAALGLADGPVVTYIARLEPSKRPLLFVDVAREVLRTHPSATFVLAGSGPLRDEVASRSAGLGAGFRSIGYVERVRDVLAASDLFCSTSGYEGFGLAVAEAMAAGVPVVAAASARGLADVMGPAGVLVESDTGGGIAAAVCRLLDDDVERSALAAAGEQRVRQRFDVRQAVRATEDLWCELAASGPARSTARAR